MHRLVFLSLKSGGYQQNKLYIYGGGKIIKNVQTGQMNMN